MKIKTLTIAAMLVVAAVALVGCSAPAPAPTATPAAATEVPAVVTEAPAPAVVTEAPAPAVVTEAPAPAVTAAAAPAQLELTADELAAYDGKDGKPAYVAVNGVIYDVTNVPAWTNGMHKGNTAGKDLTDVITKAPHGDSVLKNLTVVGKLK